MPNMDIRTRIFAAGLKHWEVAKEAGIARSTMSIWLRDSLTGERLERINAAIDRLIERRKNA